MRDWQPCTIRLTAAQARRLWWAMNHLLGESTYAPPTGRLAHTLNPMRRTWIAIKRKLEESNA